jgi:phosphatidate cytidylyltransferase
MAAGGGSERAGARREREAAGVPAVGAPAERAEEWARMRPAASLPPQRGRAGRNLPAALGVGVGLGAVVLTSLFTYRIGFVGLVVVVISLAVWELARAASRVEARPPLVPLLVGGLAMDLLAWFRGAEALAIAFLLTALACQVWRLADGPVGYLRDTSTAVFIALYVPFLAGFAVLLTVPDDGARRVVTFMATVVCSDVGGYAAGVFLGRHPMAPTVSPKKSWEGFAGSVLACVGAGAIFLPVFFDAPAWQGALYGTAIAVTATLGDLGESMIKRDLGIKDMGSILPGHGGVMDRLDSLLPAAAVAYLLLTAFAPPA